MKKLIFVFLILLIAVGLGFLIQRDPGYVLIAYGDWRIEASLWVSLLIFVLGFFLLSLISKLLAQLFSIGGRIRHQIELRHQRESARLTILGLNQIVEEDWHHAEKNLSHATPNSALPALNEVALAYIAQSNQCYTQRDVHLQNAQCVDPQGQLALCLLSLQWQLEAGQAEQALPNVQQLLEHFPKHPKVLRLAKQTYLALQDWSGLFELLPRMRKTHALPTSSIEALEQTTAIHLLKRARNNQHDLTTTWDSFPRAWRANPYIIVEYCQQLNALNLPDMALPILEKALRKNWHPVLLHQYSLTPSTEGTQQLITAEKWLRDHGNDADLLLCLGRISARGRFWTKAKSYLEQSLQIEDSASAHWELAEVLNKMGQKDGAVEHYRS